MKRRYGVFIVCVASAHAMGGAQQVRVGPRTESYAADSTYVLPLVPTRTVRFSTDEGTFMSVDVAPDGRTIAFDLLGDLYTVPVTGGQATPIMRGMALDVQPRFSPDGKRIAFFSDRSGIDRLWIVDVDGRNPRPMDRPGVDSIPPGPYSGHPMPAWTPDGQGVAARGYVHRMAGGSSQTIPGLPRQIVFGPTPVLAYVITFEPPESGRTASLDQYVYKVKTYDLASGKTGEVFRSSQPIMRPTISRDGRWLAYATVAARTASVRLRDLGSGADRLLADDVQPPAAGWFEIAFPGFAFTPDDQAIVLSTGGKIWRIDVPSGRRTLVPFSAEVELDIGPLSLFPDTVRDTVGVRQIRDPQLSPNGRTLAFIALDKLYVMDFPGGRPRRVTTGRGIVENFPAWSPDGTYLAFATFDDTVGGHIYRVASSGLRPQGRLAEAERLTAEPDLYTRLRFSDDGRLLIIGRSPWRALQKKVDARGGVIPVELYAIDVAGRGPYRRVERWTDNEQPRGAKQPTWALGSSVFIHDRERNVTARHDVRVAVPRAIARGTLVLSGGRIITMRDDEVIERGDIVIQDGRIVGISESGRMPIPRGSAIIDVAGRTILPGYVDVHFHVRPPDSTHKSQIPQYLAALAYGVTSTRNPQTSTTDFLSYADRVAAGDILGPRIFATGPGINAMSGDSLTSLEDARGIARRYAEFYKTHTLKEYGTPSRLTRQWLVIAAHEFRLSPTSESGKDWKHALSLMLDGYAGLEHSLEVFPIYGDVARLAAASGITYTPTLLVAWSRREPKHHFLRSELLSDCKLRRFAPVEYLNRRLKDAQPVAWGSLNVPQVAAGAAAILRAGGHVAMGGHGELHGLDAHWDLWLLASADDARPGKGRRLTNLEVLRVGTLGGARAIGVDRDLGSLAPGKIADLQVLDANPLENIRNTTSIRFVMKDGILYNANTLDELWPRKTQLPRQWWQDASSHCGR